MMDSSCALTSALNATTLSSASSPMIPARGTPPSATTERPAMLIGTSTSSLRDVASGESARSARVLAMCHEGALEHSERSVAALSGTSRSPSVAQRPAPRWMRS
jgi:hypothetical protein